MANEEHLRILGQGVGVWNEWRDQNPALRPELSGVAKLVSFNRFQLSNANFLQADVRHTQLQRADLRGANLRMANFSGANLREANLQAASLDRVSFNATDLRSARLREANLCSAKLREANLREADLCGAILRGADLRGANLSGTDLSRVDFSGSTLGWTTFGDTDLTEATGLESCGHQGPSVVDHHTLRRSKNVPISFWRGCGLPDALIDYMPSLTGDAIQYYSCFISYSSEDQEFAERLHADLQDNSVRCWFAPHDLPIGQKILDGIDEAIRVRDKVVLILSEGAIASDWVEDEVTTAFEEERRRKETMLFPIRLDNAVMDTDEAWANKLRARNIGDFTRWKEHEAYTAMFKRVLRDLKIEC